MVFFVRTVSFVCLSADHNSRNIKHKRRTHLLCEICRLCTRAYNSCMSSVPTPFCVCGGLLERLQCREGGVGGVRQIHVSGRYMYSLTKLYIAGRNNCSSRTHARHHFAVVVHIIRQLQPILMGIMHM